MTSKDGSEAGGAGRVPDYIGRSRTQTRTPEGAEENLQVRHLYQRKSPVIVHGMLFTLKGKCDCWFFFGYFYSNFVLKNSRFL